MCWKQKAKSRKNPSSKGGAFKVQTCPNRTYSICDTETVITFDLRRVRSSSFNARQPVNWSSSLLQSVIQFDFNFNIKMKCLWVYFNKVMEWCIGPLTRAPRGFEQVKYVHTWLEVQKPRNFTPLRARFGCRNATRRHCAHGFLLNLGATGLLWNVLNLRGFYTTPSRWSRGRCWKKDDYD